MSSFPKPNQTAPKYETIEELVAAFNDDYPFKDKWLNVCIGGREYLNKAGLATEYYLQLLNVLQKKSGGEPRKFI